HPLDEVGALPPRASDRVANTERAIHCAIVAQPAFGDVTRLRHLCLRRLVTGEGQPSTSRGTLPGRLGTPSSAGSSAALSTIPVAPNDRFGARFRTQGLKRPGFHRGSHVPRVSIRSWTTVGSSYRPCFSPQ